MMKQTVEKYPQKMALSVRRNDGSLRNWTYEQYLQDVTRVAKAFKALGLEGGHGVGILGISVLYE